jgi:hypothetical protein
VLVRLSSWAFDGVMVVGSCVFACVVLFLIDGRIWGQMRLLLVHLNLIKKNQLKFFILKFLIIFIMIFKNKQKTTQFFSFSFKIFIYLLSFNFSLFFLLLQFQIHHDISHLSDEQLLLLEQQQLLLDQQWLDNLAIVSWAQCLLVIANEGLIGWQCWHKDEGAEDDQECLLKKKFNFNFVNFLIFFTFNSR